MARGKEITPKKWGDPGVGGIRGIFETFGYEPTEEEVAIFDPAAYGGGMEGYNRGRSAVGAYVNALRAEDERKANDPLKKFSTDQATRSATQGAESQDLFTQAMNVYKSAPQLFGGLQPDQIQQYLAPVNQQAKEGLAGVEGAFGRRGLAGSSIEANAMAEQGRLYQQSVLASGLQLGVDQQSQLAALLSGRSNLLFQGAEAAQGRIGGAAGQMSGQEADTSQFLASLPPYLQQLAMQDAAMRDAASKKSTPWGAIGSVAGMGLGALLAAPTGGMSIPMGMALGGSAGGGIGSLFQNNGGAAAQGYTSQLPMWMMMNQNNSKGGAPLLQGG